MTAVPVPTRYSDEEYLSLERTAEYKSELVDGYIVAMAGVSRAHNMITTNVNGELRRQLKGRRSESYAGNMRVKAPVVQLGRGAGRSLYAYPDVVAVGGEPRFEDQELDTLLNPTVIVEVLSSSMEKYDRGEKFLRYRHIPSLQEYVLIAQDLTFVEHFSRQREEWVLREVHRPGDAVKLASVGCSLPLEEIYDKVEFQSLGLDTPG